MRTVYRPGLEEIEAAFGAAIAPHGGTIWDRSSDGERLFVRSVYPQVREVIAGDQIQRGVALRVAEESIGVYPYLFRQTNQNGAILAWAMGSRQARRVRSRGSVVASAPRAARPSTGTGSPVQWRGRERGSVAASRAHRCRPVAPAGGP